MARILSNEELTHLTIPRLQNLLKAARARARNGKYCECCGEPFAELYNDQRLRELHDVQDGYVQRIKATLQVKQSHI